MEKENPCRDKSYKFALKIVKLQQKLVKEREYVLAKQILKSGTSIGANVEEAIGGHTPKDFSAKMSIAYKEARETRYWLNLLNDSGLISINDIKELVANCEELIRITGSTVMTMKQKPAA